MYVCVYVGSGWSGEEEGGVNSSEVEECEKRNSISVKFTYKV